MPFKWLNFAVNKYISYSTICEIELISLHSFLYKTDKTDPLACQGLPCQNGGTCEANGIDNLYKCTCHPLYTGVNCENPIGMQLLNKYVSHLKCFI